jgi:hypothetical protein
VNLKLSSSIKWAAAILLAVLAITFVVRRSASLWRSGESGALVWFYDESEHQLYAAPVDIPPPHKGVCGSKKDGVRAFVVQLGTGDSKDPKTRRIAYLQTCTPELKALLDNVQAAYASGKPFRGKIPARDSDFFQTNTLVRREQDANWHPSNTPEAKRITSEWRSWRGPDGGPPQPSTP